MDETRTHTSSDTHTDATSPPLDQIGPYALLRPLGEGGMGTVYLAEQKTPVERRVALKVIKLGMDTREVIARFEAERQALAVMDHPGIARVFDGGATEAGRPFFVMEFVQGEPITQFCDRTGVTIRDRVALFIDVCRAVQHAHQKGIVHRDLKPSNVLVTVQDGRPVAKIIDFGIAKAIEKPLTDQTFATGLGQFVGTPAYMSPEQLGLTGQDVDTRADIYSLGVLLYELLAGARPVRGARARDRLQPRGRDPERRADPAERAADTGRRRDATTDRALAQNGAGRAAARPGARSRLDRAQGHREGSIAPLRDGELGRGRSAALPPRRAGERAAAEPIVPDAEIRHASPRRRRRRGRDAHARDGIGRRDSRAVRARRARARPCGDRSREGALDQRVPAADARFRQSDGDRQPHGHRRRRALGRRAAARCDARVAA